MSDVEDYASKRAARDPEFAEGLETGYEKFRAGILLDEQDVATAGRVLGALRDSRQAPGPLKALDTAPEDDEPETPEEQAAVEEALREIGEGRPGVTTEELKRELGIA